MRIVIVRHWETEENISGTIQWHLPWKLTKIWIEQARLAWERLENEKFDYIFSSDLARVVNTTKEITLRNPNKNVIYSEILRERCFWDLQWKSSLDLWVSIDNFRELIENNKSCETFEQMLNRWMQFFQEIQNLEQNANILVVTHSWIWRAIISAVIWEKDFNKIPRLRNTSVSIFEINDWTMEVICKNCVKHLE